MAMAAPVHELELGAVFLFLTIAEFFVIIVGYSVTWKKFFYEQLVDYLSFFKEIQAIHYVQPFKTTS